jgi:uncharacterized protein YgbK (DUF1537 family)
MTANPLPNQTPLIAYYGDDLTGSTAVMDATALAGLETVLFLDAPDEKSLSDFPNARVIGIAGDARSRSPDWMKRHLPRFYQSLKATAAPIIHYKVCSTFDSAPHIGSIGIAAEIARDYFTNPIPVLIGDLGMGRYQCFGHLFAMSNHKPYRIDKHPVMARHPVTPMDEADLMLHLNKQTKLKTGLVDFVSLHNGTADEVVKSHVNAGVYILFFDMLDHLSLVGAGKSIWNLTESQKFCIGSQGLESALVSYWKEQKWIEQSEPPAPASACSQILVVSGSVSSITASQIDHARAHGFATFALDLKEIQNTDVMKTKAENLYQQGLAALRKGRDVLIYSAEGPDDKSVKHIKNVSDNHSSQADSLNEKIGTQLGMLADRLLRAHRVPRLIISGGDTSGRVARMLGLNALTFMAPMAAGAPLCRAHCSTTPHDGLEVVLKGGQVGNPDLFTYAKMSKNK